MLNRTEAFAELAEVHAVEMPERELEADLFARLGADAHPQIVRLLRGYGRRRLKSWLAAQTLDGLSRSAARALCRAHIEKAVGEFAAWTPLAEQVSCTAGTRRAC